MLPAIRMGDVFCVDSNSILSAAIRKVTGFWSSDGSSEYNHAGVIIDHTGRTFETLWTARENVLDAYDNKLILIVRPIIDVDGELIEDTQKAHGIQKMRNTKEGALYPVHRLFLHFIPPLARYFSTGRYDICSELVTSEYLKPPPMNAWRGSAEGINPDVLADRLRSSRLYETIFEGELKLLCK